MDEFLKMDIFFFVTTLAVVIVAALAAYALYLIVRILRNVERLSETVSDEAVLIKGDLDDMRAQVRAEGFKWAHLARFARSQLTRLVKNFSGINKK